MTVDAGLAMQCSPRSALLCWACRRLGVESVVALEGMLVTPRVGIDVDFVAVLSEAIDERDDARCTRKNRAPLLEG